MAAPLRPTGTWTDRVRAAWRRTVGGRFAVVDRAAHRVYFHWQRVLFACRLMQGPSSLAAYLRLESGRPPDRPVAVRVRPLGGRRVWLRPGTTDPIMLRDTFRDLVHPPPWQASRPVRRIVDLGANAGITVAHNALLHPEARIVAVELDEGNAEAARRNCAWAGDRVVILQGAVWTDDGEVAYDRETGREFGFRVVDGDESGTPTRALSMDTILAHIPAGERVDYVKMDIEGVEARLLSGDAARWLERVDSIGLQVHDPYTLDDCAQDLTKLGFEPRVDRRRLNYLVAVRRLTAPPSSPTGSRTQ
jgi:FkbM family methyltransferase